MSSSEQSSMPAVTQQPASPAPSPLPAVNENSSLPSTPQSLFEEQFHVSALDRRQLGALHLLPATAEELFDIDRFKYGEYDLVDGLLNWRGMWESDRNKEQAKNLLYRFQLVELNNPISNRIATLKATIAIPTQRHLRSHQPSSSNASPQSGASEETATPARGHPRYSVIRADLAIGERLSDEARERLSPTSQMITFPVGHKPQVVVENTSSDERRDMEEIRELYEQKEIDKYIVIRNRDRAKNPQPAVHEGNLRNGKYRGMEKPLRGDDEVDLGPIGVLQAKDCINPGKPDQWMHREWRKLRMGVEEAEKKEQEEEERRQAAEKEEREEEERRQAAEKEEREEEERRQAAEKEKREEKERRQAAEKEKREEKERR
ncbi:unnamed protein product, partial [Agarophyton chilense]